MGIVSNKFNAAVLLGGLHASCYACTAAKARSAAAYACKYDQDPEEPSLSQLGLIQMVWFFSVTLLCSMGAAFGAGVCFSFVSGVPNPMQSALTTGAAFAGFNGLFYQVGTNSSNSSCCY